MTSTKLIRGILGADTHVDDRSCVVTETSDRGVVMYGPYQHQAPGRWQVDFGLGLVEDELPVGNPVCAKIEVLTNDGSCLLVERRILYSELTHGLGEFGLVFNLHEPRKLEFRVQSNGQVPLVIAQDVRVTRLVESMLTPAPRGSQQRAWEFEREFLDGYLRNVSGLIHIGANYGQERRYYWLLGLDVLWVEPIREVYEALVDNIARYPRQKAINALLTDKKGQELELGIANNGGASSSLLPLEGHSQIYPDVQYVEKRKLVSTTFADLVRDNGINLRQYQALTIDTEGAELMVLKGAGELLSQFDYIKCEASDFQSRSGNPSVADLDSFLQPLGFKEIGRRDFGMGPGYVGTNWDVVWKKAKAGEPLNIPGRELPVVYDPFEVHGLEKEG